MITQSVRETSKAVLSGAWIAALLCAVPALAQTKPDLGNQGRNFDFSGAPQTKTVRVGTGLPALCSPGELYFRNDVTPGQNLYGCTSPNAWSPLGGGGAGGASSGAQLTDLVVIRESGTQVTLGKFCSAVAPCNAQIQDAVYSYLNSVGATNPSGTGMVWFGLDSSGNRTAWHNLTALTCTGWTCAAATGFPADSVQLGACAVTSGSFDAGGCADLRSMYGRSVYSAGTGLIRAGNQFALNTAQVAVAQVAATAFSPTPAFDAQAGTLEAITLTGDVTSSTITNSTSGQLLTFKICQDPTGGRAFAWPANVKGGMTVGATASTCSVQTLTYDGTNWYATSAGSGNL